MLLILSVALLLLPLFTFKLELDSEIFPAMEIIIVYYLYSNYQIKYWLWLLGGILIDQLYNMPTGTGSLSFILTNLILRTQISKYLSNYLLDFLTFSGYCLIVMVLRYFITMSLYEHLPNLYALVFQYLSTVFLYPILKTLFDRFKTLYEKC